MTRSVTHSLFALLAVTIPTTAFSQAPPGQTPPGQAPPGQTPTRASKPARPSQTAQMPRLKIVTPRGVIEIELVPDEAPKNVANVLALAQKGFYNGLKFHRVEDWVVQGGDPAGNGTGGPGYTVQNEVNRLLRNVRGAVGMANAGRDTAGSQFYILRKDAPSLDGGNYTLIGRVLSGMEIVDAIAGNDVMSDVSATVPDNYRPPAFGPTRRAEPTDLFAPEFPEDLSKRSFGRTVKVKASVGADGVAKIVLVEKSGDPDVDNAVLDAIRRWKWQPALKTGRAVASTQTFEYDLVTRARRYDP